MIPSHSRCHPFQNQKDLPMKWSLPRFAHDYLPSSGVPIPNHCFFYIRFLGSKAFPLQYEALSEPCPNLVQTFVSKGPKTNTSSPLCHIPSTLSASACLIYFMFTYTQAENQIQRYWRLWLKNPLASLTSHTFSPFSVNTCLVRQLLHCVLCPSSVCWKDVRCCAESQLLLFSFFLSDSYSAICLTNSLSFLASIL